mmetsp:Transcript_24054/g.55905  ORF Transcript_24054/g.55905 Transcript_24054/m.55905 type:complete len:865 (-) Transcript_24054:23-2617(-)
MMMLWLWLQNYFAAFYKRLVPQRPQPERQLPAGVMAAIFAQMIFYMAPGILQPSLYLKLEASLDAYHAAQAYSRVLGTASIVAMVAPVPLGLWATKRGEREVYVGVCLLGALAAFTLAFTVDVPIFAVAWALLTFPPSVRGVRSAYFAKNVSPKELSRAGQLASSSGLLGGFLGPVASTLCARLFGEPHADSNVDGFIGGSLLAGALFLCFALVLAVTFEAPGQQQQQTRSDEDHTPKVPHSKSDAEVLEKKVAEEVQRCEQCSRVLSATEASAGTALCEKCFDDYAGSGFTFPRYCKILLAVFCLVSSLLEFSMNAGVIATFQPIVAEHFNWGNDEIAAVNVMGTGLSIAVSLTLAQMRLPEKEQAAGGAVFYLLGVIFFTAPPLQQWRLVVGMMLGLKAQILFTAPFMAVFSNLIGGKRTTNFLTTVLCLAPACGAALGTFCGPFFVEAAGTPTFFFAAVPAILAMSIILLGWSRVGTQQDPENDPGRNIVRWISGIPAKLLSSPTWTRVQNFRFLAFWATAASVAGFLLLRFPATPVLAVEEMLSVGTRCDWLAGHDYAEASSFSSVLGPDGMLPAFASLAELKLKPLWHLYMSRVYGSSIENTSFYPIDLPNFDMIQGVLAGPSMMRLFQRSNLSANRHLGCLYGHEGKGRMRCPTRRGELYRCRTWRLHWGCVYQLPSWVFVHQGAPPEVGVRNDTWVEVSHCSDVTKNGIWGGTWFYVTKGSGMWLNVGRSRVFGNHFDAVHGILNVSAKRHCRHMNSGERWRCEHALFRQMSAAAQQQGLETIQFTRHDDQRCGNTAMEILWVSAEEIFHAPCSNSSWSSRLRAGLNASCQCECRDVEVELQQDHPTACFHCTPVCS